jgi:hypothetical protein
MKKLLHVWPHGPLLYLRAQENSSLFISCPPEDGNKMSFRDLVISVRDMHCIADMFRVVLVSFLYYHALNAIRVPAA